MNSSGQKLECLNRENCALQYDRDYTAEIFGVTPSQIYRDQDISWWIMTNKIHQSATPRDRGMYEELSIDGSKMKNEYYLPESTDRYVKPREFPGGFAPSQYNLVSGDQLPSKDSKVRARFVTGDSRIRKTAQHCNFAGDECWTVRTHAVVDEISASSGSVNGGQHLKIKGWGLGKDVSVEVAGKPCQVIKSADEELTCVTAPSSEVSVDGQKQPGQPGIQMKMHKTASGLAAEYAGMLSESYEITRDEH